MVPHCGFDLHFSDSDVEHLFMCLYVFFAETSVLVFSPFFDWAVGFPDVELYEPCTYSGD